MKKFIIEREVPGVGKKERQAYCEIAQKSQGIIDGLGNGIQWQESFVTEDGTFCVYLAESEEVIREHPRRSGFPANRILEVKRVIDPSTAEVPAAV